MTGTAVRLVADTRSGPTRAAWLAWASLALYTAFTLVSLVLEFRFVGRVTLLDIWVVIALAASGVVGALFVSKHPRHPIGWMFSAAALLFGAQFFVREYALQALAAASRTLPSRPALASCWLG